MKAKPYIVLVVLSTLVLSFSVRSSAVSSVKNKNLAEETLNITNEAEYAEFVKRREGAGQASSINSKLSTKSSSSTSASSNRSNAQVK